MARVPLESLLEEYEYAKHLKNPFGAEADSFRRRLQTGAQAQWSLTTLQGLAFWNHACGARSQPWTAFEAQGAELQALRADVEKGLVPVLEVQRHQVQFAHLSFQEFLVAELLTRMLERGCADLASWLRDAAGSPWWSEARGEGCGRGQLGPAVCKGGFGGACGFGLCACGEVLLMTAELLDAPGELE